MAEEHVFRLAVRNLSSIERTSQVEEGGRSGVGIGFPLHNEKVERLRTDARLVAVGSQEGVAFSRGMMAKNGIKYDHSVCMVVYDHDKAKAKGFTDQDMFEWLQIVQDWLYSINAAHVSVGVGYGDSLGIKNHMSIVSYWQREIPNDTLLADIVMKENMKAAHSMRLDEHEPVFMRGVLAAWRYRDLNNLERYKFVAQSALGIVKATGLRSSEL